MELSTLVVLIIGGVALVVFVLHMTGATASSELKDKEDVLMALMTDYPHAMDGHVLIAADRRSGFVILNDCQTGIVRVMGRHKATRIVSREEIASVRRDGTTVGMAFKELGWSSLEARLANEADARRLERALDPVGA